MKISKAAEMTGLSAKTIRYYESVGLVPAASRRENGYRSYDLLDVHTLRFVHRARALGFSMEEVQSLLELWRDKRRASARVKAIALQKVAEIDRKLSELQAIRQAVLDLAHRCHGDDRPDCPILDSLAGEEGERKTSGRAPAGRPSARS